MARLEKENGYNAMLQVVPNQGMYKTNCNTNSFPLGQPQDKEIALGMLRESTTMLVHRKLHWVDIQDKEIALGMLRESTPMFVHRKLRCTQQKPLPGT